MYLLDTNVVSELRSKSRCDARVKAWQERVDQERCYLSVVTLLEIRQGIDQVERNDVAFAAALSGWLEGQVKAGFSNRTLVITASIAERAGRIAAVRTRGLADCLIAASAVEHHLQLVTRNVADFSDISGLGLVNPWE